MPNDISFVTNGHRHSVRVLNQGISQLGNLEDKLYRDLKTSMGNSVGELFGNAVKAYHAFIEGYPGIIFYEGKEILPEKISTDKDFALNTAMEDEIRLKDMELRQGSIKVIKDKEQFSSTVEEQLNYIWNNALHNYRLIAEVLNREGKKVSEDFCKSPLPDYVTLPPE